MTLNNACPVVLAQKVLAHGDLKKLPDPMCLRRKEVEQ